MSDKLKMYQDLHTMLECEVEKIAAKKELDDTSLNNLHKLASTMHYLDHEIERMEDSGMMEGSSNGYPYSNNTYRGNRIYIDGEGVREAMRYYPPGEHGYSRDEAKKMMIHKLETLMDDINKME